MMRFQNLRRIDSLKRAVSMIPPNAKVENIWKFLGWNEEFDNLVEQLNEEGKDPSFLFDLAPDFRDIVSIVVSGAYGFPYDPCEFDWTDILKGKIPDFPGRNPKERLLSVLESTHSGNLDS